MSETAIDMDLKDLSNLSLRLNRSTDELNAELKNIEEQINALSLGVEAWVIKNPLHQEFTSPTAPYGYPTRERVATELGYARFYEGWKLAVRMVSYLQEIPHPQQQTEWDETRAAGSVEVSRDAKPLLRAARSVRTAAVDRIPDLIDALHEAGSKVVDAVEKARKISDSLK